MKNRACFRGDVYLADLGQGIGSEQSGVRPVVILQNDLGNQHSPTVIIAPITKQRAGKEALPAHCLIGPESGLRLPSVILLEQLRTIDKCRLRVHLGHGREPKAVYHSDPDAHYVREYTFDLSKVEPVVAKPDFVDNLAPAKDVRGIKIDEAFLGSCNNGRIEDLRVGAQVIKGKKVSEKVRFLVVPASQTIYRQALEEGLIDIFMDAGAIVMNPNCSVCWGSCQGVIGENEVLISTGTRNFKGRAGHPSSKVYLGSAATVTASAIAGEIALASDV